MARGDGVHRTSARNMRLTTEKVGNAQRHNEREKESYTNQEYRPRANRDERPFQNARRWLHRTV